MDFGPTRAAQLVHRSLGGRNPDHALHVGDRDQEGSVGVAGAEERVDLEYGATGFPRIDARAVVDDPLEDRQGPDPHATMLA